MKSRREAILAFSSGQTAMSGATLGVGALSVLLVIPGSIVFFVVGGLKPYQEVYETAVSDSLANMLWVAIALGAAAAVAGFATFRTMPTKAAREGSISGAALGIQAVLYSAIFFLVISADQLELFVRANFSFEVLDGFLGAFLNGAKNTVQLAISGEAIGIALGLVLALLILSSRVVVRAPARAYINFFRGTPLLWQIAFIYFSLVLGVRLPISEYQVAMIVLGLNAGAYSAEIFRSGIQSIERSQVEGARSLGMSYLKSMRYVVLPQAFRRVIPPLTNEFIILIKDTSLVFILGLTAEGRELFSVSRDLYGETFNATAYLGAVAGYLAITLPLIRAVTALERRLRTGLAGIVVG